MKNPLHLLFLFVLSLSSVAAANARTPEETLVAFVAAVQNEGLSASARFIHPSELAAFRAEYEPEIMKRIKSARTRSRYAAFTDPYRPKQMRPFKDDADFAAVFIKWLSTSGLAGIATFENATVKPLGTIADGDLRYVVGRFKYRRNKEPGEESTDEERTSELVSVTTMKMDGRQPMLLLLPDLKNVAKLVRQDR